MCIAGWYCVGVEAWLLLIGFRILSRMGSEVQVLRLWKTGDDGDLMSNVGHGNRYVEYDEVVDFTDVSCAADAWMNTHLHPRGSMNGTV